MSRSPSLLLFVFLGLTLSLSILLLSSPHDITPSPSLRKNVENVETYGTNTKSENILKCETLKIKYNIVDVLQEIREYDARREWARLRCTSYFWSLDNVGNLFPSNVNVINSEIITETPNSFSSETPSNNIIEEKTTTKNVDPMFGRHWPETPTPDIIHTLHGTSKVRDMPSPTLISK
jgi:hypothetical protein